MEQTAAIHDVSDTSFWVAYYRARESERPDAMFKDPFAQSLVGERGRRISEAMGSMSRYTSWTVIARTVIIDRFIENLIKHEGVDAVINMGAGLDARPYRMDLPGDLTWIEADYPWIIQHKSQILKSETPRCRLTRVEVDLADAVRRREFLSQAAPQAKKVLILTEGLIVYLSPEQVTELAQDLRRHPRFRYWITEYLHQDVYKYLRSPARTAKLKNAPLKFFPDEWYGFFKALGWKEKETRFGTEIAREFKRRPPMPFMAKVAYLILPSKAKQRMERLAGYAIFERID